MKPSTVSACTTESARCFQSSSVFTKDEFLNWSVSAIVVLNDLVLLATLIMLVVKLSLSFFGCNLVEHYKAVVGTAIL